MTTLDIMFLGTVLDGWPAQRLMAGDHSALGTLAAGRAKGTAR
jgi:hypothetical protein